MTRHQAIPSIAYFRAVGEINQFIYGKDENGTVKGIALVHPHNIEAPGKLAKNKQMVADILQDKSLRKYLSKNFYKFARNVSR